MTDTVHVTTDPMTVPEEHLLKAATECSTKIQEAEITISRMREQMETDPEYVKAKQTIEEFDLLFAEATLPSKTWIDELKQARTDLIERAMSLGIESQKGRMGTYRIKQRRVRKIVPARFYEKFGAELFVQIASIKIKDAESVVAKSQLGDVVETELQGTPTVEYKLEKGAKA